MSDHDSTSAAGHTPPSPPAPIREQQLVDRQGTPHSPGPHHHAADHAYSNPSAGFDGPISNNLRTTPFGKLIALLLLAIVILIGFIAALMLSDGAAGDSTAPPVPTSETDAHEKQKNEILEELKELRRNREQLEDSTRELQRRQKELKNEIESLTVNLKKLRELQRATLVLHNPGVVAVAVRRAQDGRFELVAKAREELAATFDRAAQKARIVRIGSVNSSIANQIYDLDEGVLLPQQLADEIGGHFSREKFRIAKTDEMVAFYHRPMKRYRVGFYDERTSDSVFLQTCDNDVSEATIVEIGKDDIEPGTSMLGRGHDIIELNQQLDYISYIALRVADSLSAPKYSGTHISVAITAKIDVEDMKEQYESWKDFLLKREGTVHKKEVTENQYSFRGKRTEKRSRSRSATFHNPAFGYGWYRNRYAGYNILGFRVLSPAFPGWRSSWSARDSSFKQGEFSASSREFSDKEESHDPAQVLGVQEAGRIFGLMAEAQQLERIKREIEDYLRKRVAATGVPTHISTPVEHTSGRESLVKALDYSHGHIDQLDGYASSRSSTVSHVLFLKIGPSTKADYRVHVELYDTRTPSKALLVLGTDRRMPPPLRADSFVLGSGKLIAVNSNTKKIGKTVELPVKLSPDVLQEDYGRRHPGWLAIEEFGSRGDDSKTVRDLFGKNLTDLASTTIDQAKTWAVDKPTRVPKGHQLRHLVWQIAEKTMPIAGRIVDVRGKEAYVEMRNAKQRVALGTMGTAQRLRPQSRRSLISETNLPFRLHFDNYTNSGALARVDDFSVKSLWSEYETLQVGDIVVPANQPMPVICLLQPTWVKPTREDSIDLGLVRSWPKAKKAVSNYIDFCNELRDKLDLAINGSLGCKVIRNDIDISIEALAATEQATRKEAPPSRGGPNAIFHGVHAGYEPEEKKYSRAYEHMQREIAARYAGTRTRGDVTHLMRTTIQQIYKKGLTQDYFQITLSLEKVSAGGAKGSSEQLPSFEYMANMLDSWQP